MLITTKTLKKIKEFEGCKLQAYQDAAGVWTIGYGHTYGVRPGDRISQQWADMLLRTDIENVGRQLMELGDPQAGQWTQAQFDAVAMFVFNLGIGRWRTSTLRKAVMTHQTEADIRREWMRWVYAGGKRLAGLVRRRQWELERFFEKSELLFEIR